MLNVLFALLQEQEGHAFFLHPTTAVEEHPLNADPELSFVLCPLCDVTLGATHLDASEVLLKMSNLGAPLLHQRFQRVAAPNCAGAAGASARLCPGQGRPV